MASSTVGTAVIKLSFDGKDVKAELSNTASDFKKAGENSGKVFGGALSVAMGSLVSKAVSKVASTISSSLTSAINRVDVINNFPRVMSSLGFSTDEASASIQAISGRLDGLPSTLNGVVADVQKLTATMGNLNTGMVNATSLGLALNDMFLAGGKGTEAASLAMEQYNQMLAQGKPDMQSWRSVLNAAPGQLQQLAKTLLGATASQNDLYEALKEGNVTFDQMNEAIVRLDKEGGDGFESYEKQARAATGGIGTALENLQNRVGKAIAKIIDHIGPDKIAQVINDISAGFSGIADIVIGIIDFLGQNQWVLDGIMAFFVGLLGMGIASKVAAFFTMLSTFAATNPVVLAIGAISAVLFLVMTHLEEVGAFFNTVFGAIGEFVGGVATAIGDFFSGAFKGIMGGLEVVGGFFNGIFTTIGKIVGGAFETVKNAAQGAWNFITGIFSGLANFFGSIFSGAWEAVKAVFSTGGQIFMGIVDGIANAFRTIVNAIIRGINFVVAIPFNAINGFLNILRGINILGFQPFSWIGQIGVPQIPLLAQGGVTAGATTAVIGEEGREVVLPLENNQGNWAGLLAATLAEEMQEQRATANDKTINVYMTNEINSEIDINEMGRLFEQSIRRYA